MESEIAIRSNNLAIQRFCVFLTKESAKKYVTFLESYRAIKPVFVASDPKELFHLRHIKNLFEESIPEVFIAFVEIPRGEELIFKDGELFAKRILVSGVKDLNEKGTLEFLLENGIKVDSQKSNILEHFVGLDDLENVKLLLQKGAHISPKALYVAVDYGNHEMVKLLLDYCNEPLSNQKRLESLAIRYEDLETLKLLKRHKDKFV